MTNAPTPACRGDCRQGRDACPHPELCQLAQAPAPAGAVSTFKLHNGAVLTVHPSPTGGYVWVRLKLPDGPQPIVAIPLHLAGVVAQAIEATATTMEEACLQPELSALPRLEVAHG